MEILAELGIKKPQISMNYMVMPDQTDLSMNQMMNDRKELKEQLKTAQEERMNGYYYPEMAMRNPEFLNEMMEKMRTVKTQEKTSALVLLIPKPEAGQPMKGDQTIIAKPLSTSIYRLNEWISTSLLEVLLVRIFWCMNWLQQFHGGKKP